MASYWFKPESVEFAFGGRPLSIETGRLAKQAAGAALVTYGETVVLVTAGRRLSHSRRDATGTVRCAPPRPASSLPVVAIHQTGSADVVP